MKLKFHLLAIDDKPKSLSGAIKDLEDHLEQNGFDLKVIFAKTFTKAGIRTLARSVDRKLDLVIVDYNLEQKDFIGSEAAALIRRQFRFTDMVFYSSDPVKTLLKALAEKEVPGVLVSDRKELPDYLCGVADTVIGKAVDLNHMRGIAMAEISDMDSIMDEALAVAFRKGSKKFDSEGKDITKSFVKYAKERAEKAEDLAKNSPILDIISDGRIFPSSAKIDAIRKVAGTFQNSSSFKLLSSYTEEILAGRNKLAHVKETIGEDDQAILTYTRGDDTVVVDEEWLREFRRKLAKYNAALTIVCDEIKAVGSD